MDVSERVESFLTSQPGPKQADLRQIHERLLVEFPACRLWFSDGTNDVGKVVTNPSVGYGPTPSRMRTGRRGSSIASA